MEKFKKTFNRHFEWMALAAGLLLMALMNPYTEQGGSWCLLQWVGVSFCPGEGLGHSVAFIFRGDWYSAMQANVLGFVAIPVILGRITTLVKHNFNDRPLQNLLNNFDSDDSEPTDIYFTNAKTSTSKLQQQKKDSFMFPRPGNKWKCSVGMSWGQKK